MGSNRTEMPDFEWLETFSNWLDNKFRIPFTNFRFGIDPLIGLFPIVGDMVSLAASGMIIRYVRKYGASPGLLIKMGGNITLDFIISLIPIVGNIYDFFFKANLRNLKLLKKYYEKQFQKGKIEQTVDAEVEVLASRSRKH